MDNAEVERVRRCFESMGQGHILLKYNELDERSQDMLLTSAMSINFDLMKELYKKAKEPVTQENFEMEPVEYYDRDKLSADGIKFYEDLGIKAIKKGKVAVVTMAGGQGTRLGFNGPKGAYVFNPDANMSIFQALTDTLRDVCKKYKVKIPWYIMVSRQNAAETEKFFVDHNYFCYDKKSIHFFIQGELPMLDFNGKILLNEDGSIKMAANGHGGTLYSMQNSGVLSELKGKGIEWISINGVDNVLVKPVDPLFIGLSIHKNVLGAIKSLPKRDPEEKVGVICKKNGRVGIVEYTEISKEMANLRDADGNLVYGDAYVLFNLYNIKGLEKVAKEPLPYHVAVKKADYIDCNGNFVKAEEPNAYKFEQFIFDSYPMFDDICVLRVKREEEFAPIKNATGEDSPETALKMYREYKENHIS